MLIEFILLVTIIIFSCRVKFINVLCLFILLLPFNLFIKSCFVHFNNSTGEIYLYWKELVVIILFIRSYLLSSTHTVSVKLKFNLFIIYFPFIVIYFLFFTDNYSPAIPSIRNYIFPFLLMISVANMDKINFSKIINIIIFLAIFLNLGGVIEHFFIHKELQLFTGQIVDIRSDGYIEYSTTSHLILGMERMCGIIDAGPNMFGVVNSMLILIFLGVLFSCINHNKFLYIALIFSILGLCLSFSRAGFGIFILGFFILLIRYKKYKKLSSIIFILFILIILFILFVIIFPEILMVIEATISGNEASSAARGENFINGLIKVFDNPFGLGLGVSDNRYSSKYFTESSFINMAIEIGLIGLFIWLSNFLISLSLLNRNKLNPFSNISFAITCATLPICFLSVNPVAMPFYYFWCMLIGFGLNKKWSFNL